MAHNELSHHFRGSTRVERGWYDPNARKVTVQFPDGIRWAYYAVERSTWEKFVQAPSAGKFLREVLERHQNGPAGH